MRKLCCMALVCGFVFAMSGCGRTAGQEPIAGDASGGMLESSEPDMIKEDSAKIEDNGHIGQEESGMPETGNSLDFET